MSQELGTYHYDFNSLFVNPLEILSCTFCETFQIFYPNIASAESTHSHVQGCIFSHQKKGNNKTISEVSVIGLIKKKTALTNIMYFLDDKHSPRVSLGQAKTWLWWMEARPWRGGVETGIDLSELWSSTPRAEACSRDTRPSACSADRGDLAGPSEECTGLGPHTAWCLNVPHKPQPSVATATHYHYYYYYWISITNWDAFCFDS